MDNLNKPSDRELKQTRILVEFSAQLIELESAFDDTAEIIQTKFAIANNFALNNPDTYLALITPVSRKIKNIANLSKLAQYKLAEYRELEQYKAQEQQSTEESTKHNQKTPKTITKSPLELEIKLLEKRQS